MNLANITREDVPKATTDPPTREMLLTIEAWMQSDFLCRNYILDRLENNLYDIYSSYKTAKEVWEMLEKKYKTKDAGAKKFVIGKFLKYNMADTKTVIKQVEKIQVLIHELHAEGCAISEQFQVGSIIEKLPPSWRDFKVYLKHKRREMTMEDLILRLRVEEDHRKGDSVDGARANVIESEPSTKQKFQKFKGKKMSKLKQKGKDFKKIKGSCWVCGKAGHKAQECRHRKDQTVTRTNQAHVHEFDDNFVAVVIETNMVSNVKGWWIDTGATRHICGDKNLFSEYKHMDDGEKLYMGNSSASNVEGKGNVLLKFTSGKVVTLTDVLLVPEIRKNLVSGPILCKKGFKLVFESDMFILTKAGMYVGKGYLTEGLFKLNVLVTNTMNNNKNTSVYIVDSFVLWHARLGHVNNRSIYRMVNLNLLPKFDVNIHNKCETCTESKFARQSFKSVQERSNELLSLIHSDLCDFKAIPSRGGKNYFITFIDDYSKYCYVYLLHSKDEALNSFKTYKAEVENQLEKKIKVIRSDRGGEYESATFSDFCAQYGIVHQTTAPYTPEQNGVAERKNRTLREMINSMLNSSGLPHNLWGEALLTANFILNRIPFKNSNKSPYEVWKGRLPSYKMIKIWGCLAKVIIPLPKRTKLSPKTIDCVFIGFANASAAYRFLVYKSEVHDIHVNTILESIDAEFFEDVLPYKESPMSTMYKRTRDEQSTPKVQEQHTEPRKGSRIKKPKNFGPDFISFMTIGEPQTYKEAMTSPEALSWKEAINSEVESILQNHTWELVDIPPGSKPIGCKWIFKRKLKADGSVDKYKARLVAKGYRQKEGIDYFDTYSPVSRITSIRTLIAIASLNDMEIHQMDVKTAFLNGELDEEIYMEQLEGFVVQGQENKVCKLVKSLYGLKQAPKQWHEKFDHTMLSHGFKINECDKCVYIKTYANSCVFVCLYVDDMLIMGTSKDVIMSTKKLLSSIFDMKDLGLADVILGIQIKRNNEGYILTQSHYVEKILNKYDQSNCKVAVTPFDANCKLKKNIGDAVSQLQYSQVIGSLMYLMNATRPDIAIQ